MPVVSILFGGLLIALGVWGYGAAETKSVTALIPAFAGGLLAVLGLLALKESLLKHAMHAAAVVGLVGGVGAAAMAVPRFIREGFQPSEVKDVSQGGMALLCLIFVALCVNSFVQARRRRTAGAQ